MNPRFKIFLFLFATLDTLHSTLINNTVNAKPGSLEDRYAGVFFGTVVGGMLGMPAKGHRRGTFEISNILDTNRAGTLHLPAGTFSHEFSMALCNAKTIIDAEDGDSLPTPERFLDNYARWAYQGMLSPRSMICLNAQSPAGPLLPHQMRRIGTDGSELFKIADICFSAKQAILHFKNTGRMMRASTVNPITNKFLVRNMPMPLLSQQLRICKEVSKVQTLTTHAGSRTALKLSCLLTEIIFNLLHNIDPKTTLVKTVLEFDSSNTTIEEYIKPIVRHMRDILESQGTRELLKLREEKRNEYLRNNPIFNGQYRYTENGKEYWSFSDEDGGGENLRYHGENTYDDLDDHYLISSSSCAGATLVAAIWSILVSKSFDKTIINATNLGSDTESIAALAGQMAGAIYGFNNINIACGISYLAPERSKMPWDCAIENKKEICDTFLELQEIYILE